MLNLLGLFNAKRLENRIHCIYRFKISFVVFFLWGNSHIERKGF